MFFLNDFKYLFTYLMIGIAIIVDFKMSILIVSINTISMFFERLKVQILLICILLTILLIDRSGFLYLLNRVINNYQIILKNSFLDYLIMQFHNSFIADINIFKSGEVVFSLTLSLIYHLHNKNVQPNNILEHSTFNKDMVFLGKNINNNDVYIDDKDFNRHALVLGTTGSGKTNTLLNIVTSCAKRNLPLIYIDGKGSLKLIDQIAKIANDNNRVFRVFSINDHNKKEYLAAYNPFTYGNFTEWKNKVITLLGDAHTRGQEHYEIQEHTFISLVCEILAKSNNMNIDLVQLVYYLKNLDKLQKLANLIDASLAYRLLVIQREINNIDLIKVLESFIYSSYGKWFDSKNSNNNISLKDAINNKEIILFLLNAASLYKDTNLLGKLLINDINSVWATFGKEGKTIKGYVIFDEFAAYASPNMAQVLSLQRDNGLHAIIGTQSINAINENNLKRVSKELIANCNTFIFHKIHDPVDMHLIKNIIGKEQKFNLNINLNNANYNYILQNQWDYLLNDNDIKGLSAGSAYIYQTINNISLERVSINHVH